MTLSPRPLVSVLVRTIGRDSLARAVASVDAQTLRDTEVVIVNAAGHPLPLLLAPPGLTVRWIEPGVPLHRSAAANALLEAAAGRYAIFLDDDDWLLPDHLAKLAATLHAGPELVAAYGDVECVSAAGTPQQKTVTIYEREFDAAGLQLQNYLPIHAVLFRMETVQAPLPCRFSSDLLLFEDWDFWLQLAQRGPMRRAPGISAVYALDAQAGSGHADTMNSLRRDMLERLGARQIARWEPGQFALLVERDARIATEARARDQQADALRMDVSALRSELDVLRTQFDAAMRDISTLQGEVQRHEQEIAARNERIRETAEALREAQAHSRVQQTEIDTLSQVRLAMMRDIDMLNHELGLMRGSLSWKLTRPLRDAKAAARALPQKKPVRLARNVARAVALDLRKHGVGGFLRRVPYYLRHSRRYVDRLGGGVPGVDAKVFQGEAPQLLDIRLHPDLLPAPEIIDTSVSVVIPTFNAGPEFGWLLRKLRAQQGLREVEVVVVDSGSRDDTVRLARESGATVIEITQAEFSHSFARNLGAQHARGEHLLFTVQDAYPIGDHWLHGMISFLRDHAEDKLAAVSCAEYSRSDSDMMYDAMINTHYRFLGCLEHDRLGEWRGDDHMALRSQGQLSDVACMIPRATFEQYRYRGDYAEDLDLGIRLIKDGMRVAMLASVKAVHSHNRPAWYYFKRTYVDVVFLVGLFDDFTYPACESLEGLLAGIRNASAHIDRWLRNDGAEVGGLLSQQLAAWVADARVALEHGDAAAPGSLREPKLDDFLARVTEGAGTGNGAARQEARRFTDMFLARVEHFNAFAEQVYGPQDALLRAEAADVIRKTFAATAGAALAFYCLDARKEGSPGRARADAIHDELVAGV